jgi:hypothetical protein
MSAPTCPECAGPQIPGHPAGLLAIRHTNACSLRDAEDARQVADSDELYIRGRFSRPATDTERILLAAVGAPTEITSDPDLTTAVRPITFSVVGRSWPWTPPVEESP